MASGVVQPPSPCHTGDKTCFGYVSARDRWPIILTQAVDDVSRAVSDCQENDKRQEGKKIVEGLSRLKYQMQHDRKLEHLEDDGRPDIQLYNNELGALGSPSWFNSPWLFTECYLYRRMATYFAISEHWKAHDVFARQKFDTFRASRPAVLEIAAKYSELITQLQKGIDQHKTVEDLEQAEWVIFREMTEICLWGNATDLSLLTNLTYEDVQGLQGAEARKAAEDKILVNDLRQAFDALANSKSDGVIERQVDIVLDNAGFELFVDLVLAGYLLEAGLATTVVLHPKDIPWFVSDVTPKDFAYILNWMADPQTFFGSKGDGHNGLAERNIPLTGEEIRQVSFLFHHWSQLHAEGKIIIRPNAFWTQPSSYWRLPDEAPQLFEAFKDSQLVIFKGDLNYRKLTGDGTWDTSTPFTHAIGPLGPGSGINLLALRTCKADVVVGLTKGKDEELKSYEGGGGDSGSRNWAWSGKWALIQYSNGKK